MNAAAESGTTQPSPGQPPGPEEPTRRGFFVRGVAIVLGLVLYVPAALGGLLALLNPLRLRGESGRMIRLTMLDLVPEDGTPQKVPVVADRQDAWTHYPPEPIGAVYVRRVGKQVQAWQVICPHAGCFIGYNAQERSFACPCHSAKFDLAGKRSGKSDSPRDMDELVVEIRNQEVWVNFEKYRTGTPQKIVEA